MATVTRKAEAATLREAETDRTNNVAGDIRIVAIGDDFACDDLGEFDATIVTTVEISRVT